VAGYTRKWFTRLQMVTHKSANRARPALISLINATNNVRD